MGTDGEGRRNPARLCATAVRRSDKQHSNLSRNRSLLPHPTANNERETYTRGIDGEGQSTLQSCAPPVRTPHIRPSLALWAVSGFVSLRGVKEIATSFASRPE